MWEKYPKYDPGDAVDEDGDGDYDDYEADYDNDDDDDKLCGVVGG